VTRDPVGLHAGEEEVVEEKVMMEEEARCKEALIRTTSQ
jgi:hypothetical protein